MTAVDPIPMDDLVVSLAAAGHAPILTSLRARVGAVGETFGSRLVATEIGRNPDWALTWPRARRTRGRPRGDLAERLAAPRSPGDPGSDFIFPVMHMVDRSGLAAEVLEEPLRGLDVDDARTTLLRVASSSMLQDDPAAAAYQWTHCLTMPQAVLDSIDHGADPEVALAVAATYVLGFRAVFGRVRLDDQWRPAPHTAAGHVWTAPDDDLPDIEAEIATFGALHPDAHVAKHSLACLDAAASDPDARRLHLAAAAHLHAWWREHPVLGDPIIDADQGISGDPPLRSGQACQSSTMTGGGASDGALRSTPVTSSTRPRNQVMNVGHPAPHGSEHGAVRGPPEPACQDPGRCASPFPCHAPGRPLHPDGARGRGRRVPLDRRARLGLLPRDRQR